MNERIDFDKKLHLIRQQPCFSRLTDEEVQILAELLTEKHYKTGEIIVKQGDPIDSVYLIEHGTAEVRVSNLVDGEFVETVVANLDAKESIGLNEAGFYSLSGMRTATVVALTDMTLMRLSVAAFHGFALAYSHVNDVMRKHARQILGLGE